MRLTEAGRQFAAAGTEERKRLFRRHLLAYVPFVGHIRRVLDERPNHRAPWTRFADELEDHMSPQAAAESLRAVIGWERFAEAFAYDDQTRQFSLDNPGAKDAGAEG